jgi:hypothetical protein
MSQKDGLGDINHFVSIDILRHYYLTIFII